MILPRVDRGIVHLSIGIISSLFLISLLLFSSSSSGQDKEYIHGIDWDNRLYSALRIPDDAVICRPDSIPGHLTCYHLPSGSVLMMRVLPQDASRTIPQDSY